MAKPKRKIVHSIREVSEYFNIWPKTFYAWKALGCPGISKEKGKGTYDLQAIDAWHKARTGQIEDDPMLAGSSSPNLERYRGAQADLAELKLQQQRGELLSREAVMKGLAIFASTMRQAFETLQRQFGREAVDITSQALGEAEHTFLRGMGSDVEVDSSDRSYDQYGDSGEANASSESSDDGMGESLPLDAPAEAADAS